MEATHPYEPIVKFCYENGVFCKDEILIAANPDQSKLFEEALFKSTKKEAKFHIELARYVKHMSLWDILTNLAKVEPAEEDSVYVQAVEKFVEYQHLDFDLLANDLWLWLNTSKQPFSMHKALRFLGPTKTGKSTMIRLLTSKLNCDHITNTINNTQFTFSDSSLKDVICCRS